MHKISIMVSAALAAAAVSVASPAYAEAKGDDYPYRNDNPGQYDPWGYAKRHARSFVAWRLNQNGVKFQENYRGARWGDSWRWDDAARHVGLTVDNTPTVGSIAQWNGGDYGHVAYVAAVDGSKVTVEEYNERTSKLSYNVRVLPRHSVDHYIHFKAPSRS